MGSEREEELAELIAEIQDQLNAGQTPDSAEYFNRYPEFADDLAPYLSCGAFFETVLQVEASPVGRHRRRAASAEIDLSEFSIESQADDEALGPVFRLSPAVGQAPRELVVLREPPGPSVVKRLRASVAFHRRRRIAGLPRLLSFDRLENVPFVIRERASGASLRRLLAKLVEGRGRVGLHSMDDDAAEASGSVEDSGLDREQRRGLAARLAKRRPHLDQLFAHFESWARILDEAHRAGVVHARISPRVLIVGRTERIAGTGLGPFATGLDGRLQVPSDRRWLAPEILDPQLAPTGWKADVYGLSLALAGALTLDLPFWESGPKDVLNRVEREPTRILESLPPSIEPRLRDLLARSLSRDLFSRPESMDLWRRELSAIRRLRRLGPVAISNRALIGGLALIALGLAIWVSSRLN